MTQNTAVQCCNGNAATETTPAAKTFAPRVDIVETEGAFVVYADLPGALPYDIDLSYEQGELMLRGKVQARETPGRAIFSEYDVGDFQRVFQVPNTIDATKIDAEYKNGVLTVRLPKQEEAKPKQVPIRVQA
jgi:HSP20 family protein